MHNASPRGESVLAKSADTVIAFPFACAPGDRVAALMIVMEERPLTVPVIRIAVGLDRIWRVQVVVGNHSAILTPQEARLCAAAVFAENAYPGCGAVAARLDAAADQADGHMPFIADPVPGYSAGPVLLGLALLCMTALAFDRLMPGWSS